MKKEDVQVGGNYLAKVGARSVEVRIERENAKGGGEARSVATGKPIRVKNPMHLRPATESDAASDEQPDAGEGDVAPAKKLTKKGAGKQKRAAKAPRAKAPAKEKPISCLDAAAAVLKSKGEPMQCRAMIDAMKEQGLWTSNAPTPHATLFSALLREIGKKGAASRFKKTDRGHFEFQEPKGD
jgi:hypothetical protein